MPVVALSETRTSAGRFTPGHSGNPAGRPKGARNRATLAAEALLEENAEALARTLIDASLGGDVATARFLVGRLCPANAERTITLDLAPGREGDLVHVHAVLMRALVDGEITPKEALAVARVLAIGAKLIQFQRRLAKAARPAAPVSDQYSDAKSAKAVPASKSPSPARGGGTGRGQCDASRLESKGPLPNPPPRAGEGEAAAPPVSPLYSSRAALRASTALGRPACLFPPVVSRNPCSTKRVAA